MDVEQIVTAIRTGRLSTRDLVRITCALAERGKNATSTLGRGEIGGCGLRQHRGELRPAGV